MGKKFILVLRQDAQFHYDPIVCLGILADASFIIMHLGHSVFSSSYKVVTNTTHPSMHFSRRCFLSFIQVMFSRVKC